MDVCRSRSITEDEARRSDCRSSRASKRSSSWVQYAACIADYASYLVIGFYAMGRRTRLKRLRCMLGCQIRQGLRGVCIDVCTPYKCPQTYTRPFQKKKKKEAKRDRRLLYYVCFSWSSYCGVSCPVCDGADAGPRKVAARPVAAASREYLVVEYSVVRSAVLRSAVLRSGSRYYVYGVGTI